MFKSGNRSPNTGNNQLARSGMVVYTLLHFGNEDSNNFFLFKCSTRHEKTALLSHKDYRKNFIILFFFSKKHCFINCSSKCHEKNSPASTI